MAVWERKDAHEPPGKATEGPRRQTAGQEEGPEGGVIGGGQAARRSPLSAP